MRRTFIAAAIGLAIGCESSAPDAANDSPGDAASDVADGGASNLDAGASDASQGVDAVDATDAATPTCPTLSVTLDHQAGATPIPVVVSATVKAPDGAGLAGLALAVTATGGSVGAVVDHGDGTYTSVITPAAASGQLPLSVAVTARGCALTAQRTPLVLPTIDPSWGQPEAVRGAVNTPGYEDGPSISPDGQWLVITDYAPVDMVCCHLGCGGATPMAVDSPFCQTIIGPYGGPLRPDFPGADRIVSPTKILNKCPKACFTADYTATGGELTTVPLPPLGSYLFHRQADGSFGEPQFVGYDADGCAIPCGISFAGPTVGTSANLVYSWKPPFTSATHVYVAPITLGTKNVLGSVACTSAGVATVSGMAATPLNMTLGLEVTNATFRGNTLWFDDQEASPHVMRFTKPTGTLPSATFTPSAPAYPVVAVGQTSDANEQPFLHEASSTLYYAMNASRIATAAMTGSNPALAATFGAPTIILDSEKSQRAGAIIALGQPTLGAPQGGKDELYFEYGVWTGSGVDMNVGVITKR